jgi:hypothetical protein
LGFHLVGQEAIWSGWNDLGASSFLANRRIRPLCHLSVSA